MINTLPQLSSGIKNQRTLHGSAGWREKHFFVLLSGIFCSVFRSGADKDHAMINEKHVVPDPAEGAVAVFGKLDPA